LVFPSHELTAATATGGFAAERRRMQQISISSVRQAAGAGIYQQIAGSVMLRADGGG